MSEQVAAEPLQSQGSATEQTTAAAPPPPLPSSASSSESPATPPRLAPPAGPATAPLAAATSAASASVPLYPFPGLSVDLRVKPAGNGTDREWLELREGKAQIQTQQGGQTGAAAASPGSSSSVCVDDGNMLIALAGSEVHHPLFLSFVSHSHPFRLVSLRAPFAFPRAKPSRVTYEGYVPDGLMRSHWVVKHKFVIPSVCLVFVDWADAAAYDAQEMAACMRLAKLRGELQHRETRIVLLVAKTSRFSSAEDEAALMDKLTRGIRKAGIDSPAHRSVLAFITVDARASVKRLEPALYDISVDYYKSAVRRLRGLKTRISRTAQQLLYVRHQLKGGYFSECIKDVPAALKHYGHAYTALTAFVNTLSPALLASPLSHELKQVGLVLNHRLCRLLLQQSKWSEAIEQFNAHVNSLKRCTGLSDLLFSHYQWLSQQFHLFGDLLEQSVYHSSQRSKQVHSGFFYQTAATYAIKRKTYAQAALHRVRNGSLAVPTLVPPTALGPSAHLGQARLPYPALVDDARAVPGFSSFLVSSEPSDLLRSVLSLELPVDHSAQIIGLLNKSYERYKKEDSGRMIVHVASQIASEYFSAHNWSMAQRFFDRIATTYREEQWWMILTATLMTSYHCAKEMGRHREVVTYALELLGRYATTTTEQKERIHQHLIGLLQTPASEGGLDDDPSLVLDVPLKYRLIECDAFFLTPPVSVVYVQQAIDLMLVLDYHFPLPVSCTQIQLVFNQPPYQLIIEHDGSLPPAAEQNEEEAQDAATAASTPPLQLVASSDGVVTARLHFSPNRSLSLHVKLPATSASSTPLALQQLVSHVLLGPSSRVLRLRSWPNRREDEELMQPVYGGLLEPSAGAESAKEKKKRKKRDEARDEERRQKERADKEARAHALSMKLASVAIVPPPPAVRMRVEHPAPPLLHEYYPMRLFIDTEGDDLTEGKLRLTAVNVNEAQATTNLAVEDLPPQQWEGGPGTIAEEKKEEETKETAATGPSADSAAPSAAHAEVARFFTVADSVVYSSGVLLANQLVEVSSALPLPRVRPHSSYELTVFVRLSSLDPHQLSLHLSYTNGSSGFLLSTVERLTLTAKAPLSVKFKVFSDGSAPATPPHVPPAAAHQLTVHQRVAMHVEMDNASTHTLALTALTCHLPSDAFDMEEASSCGGEGDKERRAAEGDGLLHASAHYATRHTSNPLILASASSSSLLQSSCVILSPGERYIHVFYFTPLTAGRGRALSAHVELLWCRVAVPLSVLQGAASAPASSADGRSAHTLSERQRDDLLKRLVEEQKHRAAGEQKGGGAHGSAAEHVPPAIPDFHEVERSSPAARAELPSSDSTLATSSAVQAALQRELKVAEEEEREKKESEAAEPSSESAVDSIAVARAAMTPSSSASAPLSSSLLGIPAASPSSAASSISAASNALFQSIPVTLTHALPTLVVQSPAVHVSLLHPAVVVFGSSFQLVLVLSNHSEQLHHVRFTVQHAQAEAAEGAQQSGQPAAAASSTTPPAPPRLLLSGRLSGSCRLFPSEQSTIAWRCLPLETGFIPLPHITVTLLSEATTATNANAASAAASTGTVLLDGEEVGQVFVRARARGLSHAA